MDRETAVMKNQCKEAPIERFMRFVSPEPNSGCWLWTGCVTDSGYAQFQSGSGSGRVVNASRWILEQAVGVLPRHIYACHKCDVRSCVNLGHLFPGTQKQNMKDCRDKLRSPSQWMTRCKYDHPWRDWNITTRNGNRRCVACQQIRTYLSAFSNIGTGMCQWGHAVHGDNAVVSSGTLRCRLCLKNKEKLRRIKAAQRKAEADRIEAEKGGSDD